MTNAVVIIILVAIAALALSYLYRAKRRGEKCIGCPYARQCGGKCAESDRGGHDDKKA